MVQQPLLVVESLLDISGHPLLPVLAEGPQDGQALPVRDVSVPDYRGGERFHNKMTKFNCSQCMTSKAKKIN